jgi:hypothetical protein
MNTQSRNLIRQKLMTTTRVFGDDEVVMPPPPPRVEENMPADEKNEGVVKNRFLQDDELSLDTNLLPDNGELNACFYTINRELDNPFLEYLFILKNNEYTLPSETYTDADKIPESFSDFFSLDTIFGDYKRTYKGFIQNSKNSVFVFFEITATDEDDEHLPEIMPPMPPPKQSVDISDNIIDETQSEDEDREYSHYFYESDNETDEPAAPPHIWAITDEIVYHKNVKMINIGIDILEFFAENPFLHNQPTSPHLLYLCQDGDNIYSENENIVSMVNLRVEHRLFGNTFLFSETPLNPNKVSTVKRYAVFTENPLYIPCIDLAQIDSTYILEDKNRNVFFTENKVKYWSIKSDDSFIDLYL